MKGLSAERLRVNVDRIPEEGLAILGEAPIHRFSALKDASLDGSLGFDSALHLEIRLRRISRFVEAFGQVRTSLRLSCSRCLTEFSRPLSIAFEATYSEAAPVAQASGDENEIELTAEAIDLFPFHGREIDLIEAIQEQVLLALPLRPLCREDCKGLCPRCGADLNQGVCECSEKTVDPRLAVLKNLKIDGR